MRLRVWSVLLVGAISMSATCYAAKSKKAKTRSYHNERSGFCADVPANWNGPAEVPSHPGGRFDAPRGDASITFALSPNQPRSVALGEKDAGSQMASLDDYREAIPNTWRNDHTVSDVKVVQEDQSTLNGVPALHIELAYKRSRATWRYEIVFALRDNQQYALEYDATKRAAKHYQKAFDEAVSSFAFHCSADRQ